MDCVSSEGYSDSFQILAVTNSAATWYLDHGAFCEARLHVNSGYGSAECTASFRGRSRTSSRGKGVQDLCYTFHNPPVGSPASVFLTMDGISSTAPDKTAHAHIIGLTGPLQGTSGNASGLCSQADLMCDPQHMFFHGPGPQSLHFSQRNNGIYI